MIAAALNREWRLKALMTVGLSLLFCIPYFTLQRVRFFEARELELTWVDRAIVFDPDWIWVYQSAYLLMPVGPWLATSRRDLGRYTAGFLMVSLAGFLSFALLPVVCPRPGGSPENWMYRLVTSYDGTGNAFPSLHCALAVYAALAWDLAARGSLARASRWGLRAFLAAWTIAICWSTLATKQHYWVDVPSGAGLGWLCHWAARRAIRLEATFTGGQLVDYERKWP